MIISSVVHRYDIEPLEPGKKVSLICIGIYITTTDHVSLPIVAHCRRILEETVGIQCRYETKGRLRGFLYYDTVLQEEKGIALLV
jgi:hypothetical protein